jgi:replicative superfamily II helicase
LYIAPYRALVNEVVDKLTETLGSVGYRVSNLAGGFEFDAFQNFLLKESDVLIATPEKVELLFRTHPDYFEQISTVVIDEGHILDEGIATVDELSLNKTLADNIKRNGTLGRGSLLELLITRLKHKIPNARFLFLSAVMPDINIDDFVNWLCKEKHDPVRISRLERPSRQVIATFRWILRFDRGNPNGQLEYISLPALPDGRKPFVPDFLQRTKYFTGELTPRTGKAQQQTWPTSTDNKTQSTALLAVRFATSGPVLVFCALPSQTQEVVNNVITALKYSAASGLLLNKNLQYVRTPTLESFDLAVEWLGNDHPLTQGLHYGVGLHYGALPDPVRQAVEDDFRSGDIKILVSTNTLGQGVNMPVKTAIIYSLERAYWDEESEERVSQFVKKRDFWNICGRAGRAGKETEGQIIFVISTPRDEWIFNRFNDEENLEEVESALYKLLLALIEKRIFQDDLIGYFDTHILALLAEEVVDTTDEVSIREFLGTSLVGVQALRHGIDLALLVSAIQQTSLWINQQIPEKSAQKIFASTGLSVASCQILEKAVDAFVDTYALGEFENVQELFTVDNRLLEAAFRAGPSVRN